MPAAIALGHGHPPGKAGENTLYDVHLHLDFPAHPISMGEQWGSAGGIGGSFTLQEAAEPRHAEHLKICGCEWLQWLAAEEKRRVKLFTPEEIWARKPAVPPTSNIAPSQPAEKQPVDETEVIETIRAAIQIGEYEILEGLRDHLNERIVRTVVADWSPELSWSVKDAYAALLQDQTGRVVRPLYRDALNSPTPETRAYALCVLMEDFGLFDSIMSDGGVDAAKVDAAIENAGLR
jgi:hypothetical protein